MNENYLDSILLPYSNDTDSSFVNETNGQIALESLSQMNESLGSFGSVVICEDGDNDIELYKIIQKLRTTELEQTEPDAPILVEDKPLFSEHSSIDRLPKPSQPARKVRRTDFIEDDWTIVLVD
jgi:hypothetical protein